MRQLLGDSIQIEKDLRADIKELGLRLMGEQDDAARARNKINSLCEAAGQPYIPIGDELPMWMAARMQESKECQQWKSRCAALEQELKVLKSNPPA